MSALTNLFSVLFLRLRIAWEGIAAFFQIGAAILSASGDGLKAKAAAAIQDPRFQRVALRPLRAFLPTLVLPRPLIGAYPNTGTAIVTRYQDVVEVLDRNADFEVVYEPKMRAITGGENFFLGMQDTALYTRDVSNMRLAMRRTDVDDDRRAARARPRRAPGRASSRTASTSRTTCPCSCRRRSSPTISASPMAAKTISSRGRR